MSIKLNEMAEGVIAQNNHVIIPASRHWFLSELLDLSSGAVLELASGARLVIIP